MFIAWVVFVAACLGGKAPIAGRLVDHSTGLPVAEFEVSVELRRREPIRLVTDANGFFSTQDEFAKTRYSLALVDHARSPAPKGQGRARVAHDPELTELREFRVVTGPRFELELVDSLGEAILDPEQYDAFLYHDRPLARALPGGREAPRAPLRGTRNTWTRFRDRQCEVVLAGGPWWLEVRSLDGLFGGGVRIESLRPDDSKLRVVVEPRCVLDGRVVDQEGKPISGAALRLKQAGDLAWHAVQAASEQGEFRFANLEGGEYELSVCDPRAKGSQLQLTLAPGATDGVELIAVERFAETDLLVLQFTSNTGEYMGAGEVVLDALDKELFDRPRATLHWLALDDGSHIANFEIEIPVGERYRVMLDTIDVFDWGSVAVASSADSPLALQLDDRRQLLEVLIEDATDGSDIDEAELAVHLGLYNDWLNGTYVEVEDIPLSARPETLSWCVTAPGYVPQFGDLSAFDELQGGARALTVGLERGWGNRIEVYDRRTLRPVSGVRVLLDGELAGVTQGGWLDVRLEAEPETLDISLDGWRWVGGSLDYRREDLLREEVVPLMLWMVEE